MLPPTTRSTPILPPVGLPGFQVQVSLAFWQDNARIAYDPCAPSVTERIEGIYALKEAGVPIVLRTDPLFPRSPLPLTIPKTLAEFNLPEAQSLEDLQNLITLARSCGVRHVVYSPVKIVFPRGRGLNDAMKALLTVYQALAAPGKPLWRGMSWRLPPAVARQHVVGPFLTIC